ncbi:hypothetical protein LTR37_009338 [Vermiconidia calcicola]|uniref:Uncharacterized protein n=1 Tax=Vermiconidia calcicola TaxID=1690605 RepID=A0ACC3N8P3_9PEZI|nr:hypothetical protein LTR37_009338 [Vermiconidia calcicola]
MEQHISKSPYDIDDLEAQPRFWNGPYWLDDALASDNLAVAASEGAATARLESTIKSPIGVHYQAASPVQAGSPLAEAAHAYITPDTTNTVRLAPGPDLDRFNVPNQMVTCTNVAFISSGRQAAKILKCGIAGCTSDKLFDRKYELQHHMEGHGGRICPCLEPGCSRTGSKAFVRADKRNEHMRKVHGRDITRIDSD